MFPPAAPVRVVLCTFQPACFRSVILNFRLQREKYRGKRKRHQQCGRTGIKRSVLPAELGPHRYSSILYRHACPLDPGPGSGRSSGATLAAGGGTACNPHAVGVRGAGSVFLPSGRGYPALFGWPGAGWCGRGPPGTIWGLEVSRGAG